MANVKVWDLSAEGGPVQIEMGSLKAKDAVKFDPKRYSFEAPAKAEPKAKVDDKAKP